MDTQLPQVVSSGRLTNVDKIAAVLYIATLHTSQHLHVTTDTCVWKEVSMSVCSGGNADCTSLHVAHVVLTWFLLLS